MRRRSAWRSTACISPACRDVVGPFSYTDARAFANVPAFDWTAFKNLKASAENARAAQLSIDDGKDLVVEAVASGYITILADSSRIEVTKMQIRPRKLWPRPRMTGTRAASLRPSTIFAPRWS